MNILITGYKGFVGRNLVAEFSTDHVLYGIDMIESLVSEVIPVNWTQLESIDNIDVVIHLAGKAHDIRNISDAKSYFEVNVGLTKRIFDWFVKSSAQKFIFFSSVKAVADSLQDVTLIEEKKPEPKTPYGQSKLEAESYILSKTVPENKKIFILRPCMIHGPGNKGNLNLLYKFIKTNVLWPLGSFDNKRSFLSIDNLTFVLEILIRKDILSGVYQVADDEPLSTNRLIELISDSLKKKNYILKVPKILIESICLIGDIFHLPLNSERLKKLTESYVVSNVKLKNALSIEKLPITAYNGMMKTLNSFEIY